MKITTAHNHFEVSRRRLLDSIHPYNSHATIVEKYKSILAANTKIKCPAWVNDKLGETLRTRIEFLYHDKLVWCVLEWEGKRYNTWDSTPEDGKEFIRTHKSDDLAPYQYHYWISSGVKF